MRPQLEKLRAKMAELGIDVYIVSDKDEHLSEYTSAHFCALEEFSGFTGGDGTLAVSRENAALWTDGRYFTQAETELEGSGICLMRMGEQGTMPLQEWIRREMPEAGRLGFDGKCTSYAGGMQLRRALMPGQEAVSDTDVCGLVWEGRPAERFGSCWILEERYSGMSAAEKFAGIRGEMKKLGAAAHVMASLDDIAWTLNLRGSDIPHNPVFSAYLLLSAERAVLYTDPQHFEGAEGGELYTDPRHIAERGELYTDPQHIAERGAAVLPYLAELGVETKAAGEIFADLKEMPGPGPFLIDRRRCSYELVNSLPAGSRLIDRMSPAMTMKCCKNETERANIRIAQHKDSIAVTKFLYWFRQELKSRYPEPGTAGLQPLTEWECAEKLHVFRAAQPGFLDECFETISAYGPNAAMAHYMPSPDPARVTAIEPRGFYLVDSGGQYLEGTTDITRTVACGPLTKKEREAFTLAVIANLRLADARFPDGVSGLVLDYAAREPFWRRGMNYNHGTGHGVGHVLNVHESPVGIRYKASTIDGTYPMKEGMYVSDEPGYYEAGAFGVRLENMLLAVPDYANAYGAFLRFEVCTFVPFDTSALERELMSAGDICLLNDYHQRVFEEIGGELDEAEREWLRQACAPV